jgi:predicted transcriptional regulator
VVEKRATESTSAIVYGEKIRFGVIERSRQVKLTPKANGSSLYSYNPIRLEPTGILSIEVWNYYSGGPQKVWRDRESIKLEEQLPKCVAGMMRIALKERADEQARKERELVRQKKIDEVAAELELIEAEQKKVRVLRSEVAAWHRAERIRKYVAAVRGSALRDTEWIAWAERQADRLDPLKEPPKSIVDDKEEVLRRLHSVRWGW